MELLAKVAIACLIANDITCFDNYFNSNYINTIRDVATELQLIDEFNSTNYYPPSNLDNIRGYYRDLKDAPRLEYTRLFEIHKYAANNELYFARKYKYYLEAEQEYFKADNSELIKFIELRMSVWNEIETALSEYSTLYTKRRSLKYIRDNIGEENFYNGIVPQCVPIRLLKRLD